MYSHLKRSENNRFTLISSKLVDFEICNWQSKTLDPCLHSCLFKQEKSNLFVISQCARERPLSWAREEREEREGRT